MESLLQTLLDQSAGLVVAVLVIWRLDVRMSEIATKIDVLATALKVGVTGKG